MIKSKGLIRTYWVDYGKYIEEDYLDLENKLTVFCSYKIIDDIPFLVKYAIYQ